MLLKASKNHHLVWGMLRLLEFLIQNIWNCSASRSTDKCRHRSICLRCVYCWIKLGPWKAAKAGDAWVIFWCLRWRIPLSFGSWEFVRQMNNTHPNTPDGVEGCWRKKDEGKDGTEIFLPFFATIDLQAGCWIGMTWSCTGDITEPGQSSKGRTRLMLGVPKVLLVRSWN